MRTIFVVLAVVAFAGCDKPAQQPTPDVKPAAVAPVVAPPKAPAKLTVDGQDVPIGSVLAWELSIAGSRVAQLYFYGAEVACEDRVTHQGTRIYSAVAISEDGFPVGGPYDSPNWSFSDRPQLVPMDNAKVTIAEVTESEVRGTANYTSKVCSTQADCSSDADCGDNETCDITNEVCTKPCPFNLVGDFTAKRCPIYE